MKLRGSASKTDPGDRVSIFPLQFFFCSEQKLFIAFKASRLSPHRRSRLEELSSDFLNRWIDPWDQALCSPSLAVSLSLALSFCLSLSLKSQHVLYLDFKIWCLDQRCQSGAEVFIQYKNHHDRPKATASLKGLVHLGVTLTCFFFFLLLLLFCMTPEYCGRSTPAVVY